MGTAGEQNLGKVEQPRKTVECENCRDTGYTRAKNNFQLITCPDCEKGTRFKLFMKERRDEDGKRIRLSNR